MELNWCCLDDEHQRQTPSTKKSAVLSKTALAPATSAPTAPAGGNLILAPSDRQAALEASTSTARTGPSKILRIFINSIDDFAQSISLCVTTDTYIGEVLEQVCRKKKLEKSGYVLKLHQRNILAPMDRMVESLADNTDLELIKRKFMDGLGDRPGSPSSADPNSQ